MTLHDSRAYQPYRIAQDLGLELDLGNFPVMQKSNSILRLNVIIMDKIITVPTFNRIKSIG